MMLLNMPPIAPTTRSVTWSHGSPTSARIVAPRPNRTKNSERRADHEEERAVAAHSIEQRQRHDDGEDEPADPAGDHERDEYPLPELVRGRHTGDFSAGRSR